MSAQRKGKVRVSVERTTHNPDDPEERLEETLVVVANAALGIEVELDHTVMVAQGYSRVRGSAALPDGAYPLQDSSGGSFDFVVGEWDYRLVPRVLELISLAFAELEKLGLLQPAKEVQRA